MSLNTTANDETQEWEAFCSNEVESRIAVSRYGNLILPDSEGSEFVVAIFKKMLCEDYWEIEKSCQLFVEAHSNSFFQDSPSRSDRQIRFLDYQEFKCCILRRMIKKISLFDLKHTQ